MIEDQSIKSFLGDKDYLTENLKEIFLTINSEKAEIINSKSYLLSSINQIKIDEDITILKLDTLEDIKEEVLTKQR